MSLGMKFQVFTCCHCTADNTIDHQMRDINVPIHTTLFTQYQRTRFAWTGDYVPIHLSVYAHSAAETDSPVNDGVRAYQRINPILWLTVFPAEQTFLLNYERLTLCRAPGSRAPCSNNRT